MLKETLNELIICAITMGVGYYLGVPDIAAALIIGAMGERVGRYVKQIIALKKRRDMAIRPAAFGDKDTKPRPRGTVTKMFARNQGKSLMALAEISKLLETDDVVITGQGLRLTQSLLEKFGITSELISDDQGERLIVTRKDNPNI
jgi:hypothetical protein